MGDIAIIDLGIILFLLYFVIRGFQQGLIRQTMALLGLLLGLKLASTYYPYASTYLQVEFSINYSLANIIGFAVILISVVIIVNLFGWLLSSLTKFLFLSFIDRLIGAFLGLVKGGILVYLLLLLISKVPYQQISSHLDKSILAKDLLSLTPYIQENLDKLIRP